MAKFKEGLARLLIWIGIYAIIFGAWWIIDCIQFGSPQPSVSDSIFSVILAYSLYDNMHIEIWVSKNDSK